jgi:hypothetical protein
MTLARRVVMRMMMGRTIARRVVFGIRMTLARRVMRMVMGRTIARVVLGTGMTLARRVVMRMVMGRTIARRVVPGTGMTPARRVVMRMVMGSIVTRGTIAGRVGKGTVTGRVMFTASTTGMTDSYAISITFDEIGTAFVDTRIELAEFFH